MSLIFILKAVGNEFKVRVRYLWGLKSYDHGKTPVRHVAKDLVDDLNLEIRHFPTS